MGTYDLIQILVRHDAPAAFVAFRSLAFKGAFAARKALDGGDRITEGVNARQGRDPHGARFTRARCRNAAGAPAEQPKNDDIDK